MMKRKPLYHVCFSVPEWPSSLDWYLPGPEPQHLGLCIRELVDEGYVVKVLLCLVVQESWWLNLVKVALITHSPNLWWLNSHSAMKLSMTNFSAHPPFIAGWRLGTFGLCFHILGMSSSQHIPTDSYFFQRGRYTTNHL